MRKLRAALRQSVSVLTGAFYGVSHGTVYRVRYLYREGGEEHAVLLPGELDVPTCYLRVEPATSREGVSTDA